MRRCTTPHTAQLLRRRPHHPPAHCSLLISDRQMAVENERKVNVLCRLLEWMADRGEGTRMGESGEGGREKKKKTQEVALHQYLPPSLKKRAQSNSGKQRNLAKDHFGK